MGSAIRLYFDENVQIAVAEQMRARGVVVVTVRELGLLGDSDQNHLARAKSTGYVVCTYDDDFLRLASEGTEHAGTMYANGEKTLSDWVKGLELICGVLTAEEMLNHIEYI